LRTGKARSTRLTQSLLTATIMALVLLWLSPDAWGDDTTLSVDEDHRGAPYASGELLVTYEPEATERDVDEAVQESEARIEEELPRWDTQLLSFPEVQEERNEEAREQQLEQAKDIFERDSDVEHVDYNYVRELEYVPNDPYFAKGRLWGLKKIGAPGAWDRTRGHGVKVAVVDTGIVANHPDIKGKVVAQEDLPNDDIVAEDDDLAHGTHVAGTVAALTNNRRGVAGGCPKCGLLVAKAGDYTGLTDADVVEGIYWSVENGAKVINLSLGGPGNSWALERAVNYAWEQGVVVVAAAGNQNTSAPHYPSGYANVISVAATTKSDGKASFSNYGKVDVAAPGVGIVSTVSGRWYGTYSGTSMASPHVAALAGLLAAQGRSAPEIRQRIESTAVDLGPAGKDAYFGWGRIHARRAVN
jgi:thermitase